MSILIDSYSIFVDTVSIRDLNGRIGSASIDRLEAGRDIKHCFSWDFG
jgi:hypothetical protein